MRRNSVTLRRNSKKQLFMTHDMTIVGRSMNQQNILLRRFPVFESDGKKLKVQDFLSQDFIMGTRDIDFKNKTNHRRYVRLCLLILKWQQLNYDFTIKAAYNEKERTLTIYYYSLVAFAGGKEKFSCY